MLTQKQSDILAYIRDYIAVKRYPPTHKEIMLDLDISSLSVVNYNLRALERKGHIERDEYVARGIRVVPQGT